MKKIMLLAGLTILAGCASAPQGVRLADLRSPEYFRGERSIPLTFPKIQMALIKHQRACGSAPQLRLDPRETNYGTIILQPPGNPGDSGYDRTIIADVIQYQASMMEEGRSRAKVYSYYSDALAKEGIEALFAAITKPEVCPGTTQQ
jgi:hypothetical protein